MSARQVAIRIGAFIRSVLPAQCSHWLILLGPTFLFISHHLRWWPHPGASKSVPIVWALVVPLLAMPIVAAGAAGYYLALLPCQRLARRVVATTLILGLASLLTIPIVVFFWFRDTTEPMYFVLQFEKGSHLWNPGVLLRLISNLGPGSQFAAAGFVLVTIFAVLLRWGPAALPIRLIPPGRAYSEQDNRHVMLFVWMMICLLPVARMLDSAIGVGIWTLPWVSVHLIPSRVTWFVYIFHALTLLLLVLFALGSARRQTLRQSFHVPPPKYIGLGVLFPAMIAGVWPMVSYLYVRVHWAAYEMRRSPAPDLGNYFTLPGVASLWYLVPALVEEIAWRGYLQPRFIRRYGLIRGVFLVGIVWGAFHFSGDFDFRMMPADVAFKLITRLTSTIAHSYVLAWLTLRSQSILPAAVAHGVSNICLTYLSPIRTPFWLLTALWAVLGYVLFRYFPPQLADESAAPESPPTLEPAL